MIRKQVYIEVHQEKALKRQAKALGVSEAELMRQALDSVLKPAVQERPKISAALEQLFNVADELTSSYKFETDDSFDRQTLYEDDNRQKRWS